MEFQDNDYRDQAKKEMENILTDFVVFLKRVRTGKANLVIFEGIYIDYYGKSLSISQVASFSILEGRSVIIQPWDIKVLSIIEKAILSSNLSLNPNNDGRVLRIIFPPLTEESRKNVVRKIRMDTEKYKVIIRGIRRNILEEIKKEKKDKDLEKVISNEVQKITDFYVKNLDNLLVEKEIEVMTV